MSSSSRKKSRSKSVPPLHSKLANKIVSESLNLKPGETLTIEAWNNGLDFAKEVVKSAKKIGAFPLLIFEDEDTYIWGLNNTPKEALGKMGKHELGLLSSTDAYVFIPGPSIGTYTPSIPKEQGSAGTAYNSSWYEAAENAGVRGVRLTFGYVGPDLAKILGKKTEDIVLRQMKAALVSSDEILKTGTPIMQRLSDGTKAKLETAAGTLEFRLNGDLGIEDGIASEADVAAKNNISYVLAGMIWKEVDAESANGKVTITSSITRAGWINGAVLEFRNGRLVSWKGKDKQNQQKLDKILSDVPEEKRKLTMITIGLNPEISYGFAQDRFVSGAISLSGFGLSAVASKGTLTVESDTLVQKGKVATLSEVVALP